MSKRSVKVSRNYARKQFTTVGLALILYVLIVLLLPEFLRVYFTGTGMFDGKSTIITTGILYTLIVIGTLVPFLLLKQSCGIKLKDYWRSCNATFGDILVDAVVFTAIGTLFMFISLAINNYIRIGDSLITSLGISSNGLWALDPIFFLLFVVATPLVEEIAFRGILLRVLGRYGNYFAMIACSLVYAVLHGSIAEVFQTFFLSIILIKITLRYRSIEPSVVIHMIFNAVIYFMSLVPTAHYYAVVLFITAIYILATIFMITKRYRIVRVKKKKSDSSLYKLFFSNYAVMTAIIISIIYTVLVTFL